jgi:hypothetical protein
MSTAMSSEEEWPMIRDTGKDEDEEEKGLALAGLLNFICSSAHLAQISCHRDQ